MQVTNACNRLSPLALYNTIMINKKHKYIQQNQLLNSLDTSWTPLSQQTQPLPIFSNRPIQHPHHSISVNTHSIDVVPLKTLQYTLPPLSKNRDSLNRQKSTTISPKQARLSPKKSNPRFKKYFNTAVLKRRLEKLNLKGKRYDPVPSRSMRNQWMSEDNKNVSYNATLASQTVLFNKKKEDVMKSVLAQIQPKFK